jgi:SAM-dependent methyltransferase
VSDFAEVAGMTDREHWDEIYRSKPPSETSWHTPHLDRSLALIRKSVPDRSSAIIDIGAGRSTLVDDLLADGYSDVTVLDLSGEAIEASRQRLGDAAGTVCWLAGDITRIELDRDRYELWHDRAAFHFLVEAEQRRAYVRQLSKALMPGGHAVIATFGPQGPERCSGLATRRYDADLLQAQLDPDFRLIESAIENHQTPLGVAQQFLYCHFMLG